MTPELGEAADVCSWKLLGGQQDPNGSMGLGTRASTRCVESPGVGHPVGWSDWNPELLYVAAVQMLRRVADTDATRRVKQRTRYICGTAEELFASS